MFARALVAVCLFLLGAASANAQKLSVGDPAPRLVVKEFVKGAPITAFQKGRVYVVEFWSTWCAPCRESIAHLTEIQRKHTEVTCVGVSVWETDQNAVRPFVRDMGPKMAFCVALDRVTPGAGADQGAMARTWLTAAGQDRIPACFIINREGRVAWIGYSPSLDGPLAQILSGKWSLSAAAAQQKLEAVQSRVVTALREKLAAAQSVGDVSQALDEVEQALRQYPALEPVLAPLKFRALRSQNEAKAEEYGSYLVDTVLKSEPMALNDFAWSLVDPQAPAASPAMAKLALKAAARADELQHGNDAATADTLAKAYFDTGDVAKALETQERAVRLAKGTAIEKDPSVAARLEQYRKAANRS